jgi:hypothetical protein
MRKIIAITLAISAFMLPAQGYTVYGSKDHKQYKDTATQKIRSGNVWHDFTFGGKPKTIKGNGKRSLYCVQVGVSMKGKNPDLIKIRFARHLPNGTLDTTGTNTYTNLGSVGSPWFASQCWEFNSKYPVSAQIKIIGKSKYYYSTERQFKMWTPGANYPVTFPVATATPQVP